MARDGWDTAIGVGKCAVGGAGWVIGEALRFGGAFGKVATLLLPKVGTTFGSVIDSVAREAGEALVDSSSKLIDSGKKDL